MEQMNDKLLEFLQNLSDSEKQILRKDNIKNVYISEFNDEIIVYCNDDDGYVFPYHIWHNGVSGIPYGTHNIEGWDV
jgi:hypothetical protein